MKKLTRAIFIITTLSASCAIAETTDYEASHTVVSEPEKVYVETSGSTYRGTRSDEYCFYNDEHEHIHCYDEDPQSLNDRVVVTENRTYRSTRRRQDSIATGIGVGIAISLPILVYHAVHDRHNYRNRYSNRHDRRHSYRNSYRNSHRNGHRNGYRNGYRNDHRGNRHNSRYR